MPLSDNVRWFGSTLKMNWRGSVLGARCLMPATFRGPANICKWRFSESPIGWWFKSFWVNATWPKDPLLLPKTLLNRLFIWLVCSTTKAPKPN